MICSACRARQILLVRTCSCVECAPCGAGRYLGMSAAARPCLQRHSQRAPAVRAAIISPVANVETGAQGSSIGEVATSATWMGMAKFSHRLCPWYRTLSSAARASTARCAVYRLACICCTSRCSAPAVTSSTESIRTPVMIQKASPTQQFEHCASSCSAWSAASTRALTARICSSVRQASGCTARMRTFHKFRRVIVGFQHLRLVERQRNAVAGTATTQHKRCRRHGHEQCGQQVPAGRSAQ